MSKYFIYVLRHPLTGEPRYIGKTIDPKRRYAQHVRAAKRDSIQTPVSLWIRKLLSQGLSPQMENLASFASNSESNAAEITSIAKFREECVLLNVTDGADGMTSDTAKRLASSLGPDGLSAKSKKAMATMGKEGLSAKAIKAHQTLGIAGRKQRAAVQIQTLGPDGLSNRARKRAENLGVKRLKEIAKKRSKNVGGRRSPSPWR